VGLSGTGRVEGEQEGGSEWYRKGRGGTGGWVLVVQKG